MSDPWVARFQITALADELLNVNDPATLAKAEAILQARNHE